MAGCLCNVTVSQEGKIKGAGQGAAGDLTAFICSVVSLSMSVLKDTYTQCSGFRTISFHTRLVGFSQ